MHSLCSVYIVLNRHVNNTPNRHNIHIVQIGRTMDAFQLSIMNIVSIVNHVYIVCNVSNSRPMCTLCTMWTLCLLFVLCTNTYYTIITRQRLVVVSKFMLQYNWVQWTIPIDTLCLFCAIYMIGHLYIVHISNCKQFPIVYIAHNCTLCLLDVQWTCLLYKLYISYDPLLQQKNWEKNGKIVLWGAIYNGRGQNH